MKWVYAADLHGDRDQYTRLQRLVAEVGAAALLLGGDHFAHATDPAGQVAFARGPLREFLATVGVPVFAIAGNVDWPVAFAELQALEAAGRLRILGLDPVAGPGGVPLLGYPHCPPTPFRRKDYERRDRAGDRYRAPMAPVYTSTPAGARVEMPPDFLDRLPSMAEDLGALGPAASAAVWVMHSPPAGGGLDVLQSGAHVGSAAMAERIAALQPPLTLHGHIHEAPAVSGAWAEARGRTVSVNPGAGARIHAVVFDPADPAGTLWHTVYGAWGGRPG